MPPFDALFAAWTNLINTFGTFNFGASPDANVGSSLGIPFFPTITIGS